MKARTFPIKVSASNRIYHVADVGLDSTPENENIYYTFKEKWKSQHGWDINEEAIAGRPDHLSFHTDGTIHMKHKGTNRNKSKEERLSLYHHLGELPDGLLPQSRGVLTPLLIDSIYTSHGSWPLPVDDTDTTPHPWEFQKVTEFSVLVFIAERGRYHATFPVHPHNAYF